MDKDQLNSNLQASRERLKEVKALLLSGKGTRRDKNEMNQLVDTCQQLEQRLRRMR